MPRELWFILVFFLGQDAALSEKDFEVSQGIALREFFTVLRAEKVPRVWWSVSDVRIDPLDFVLHHGMRRRIIGNGSILAAFAVYHVDHFLMKVDIGYFEIDGFCDSYAIIEHEKTHGPRTPLVELVCTRLVRLEQFDFIRGQDSAFVKAFGYYERVERLVPVEYQERPLVLFPQPIHERPNIFEVRVQADAFDLALVDSIPEPLLDRKIKLFFLLLPLLDVHGLLAHFVIQFERFQVGLEERPSVLVRFAGVHGYALISSILLERQEQGAQLPFFGLEFELRGVAGLVCSHVWVDPFDGKKLRQPIVSG